MILFPTGFFCRLLGSSLLNTLSNFLFFVSPPPPAYHTSTKLGAQAQALPVARRKPSTSQQCFGSSKQRSLWPHTVTYRKHPQAQLMQPFPNNRALGRSLTTTLSILQSTTLLIYKVVDLYYQSSSEGYHHRKY